MPLNYACLGLLAAQQTRQLASAVRPRPKLIDMLVVSSSSGQELIAFSFTANTTKKKKFGQDRMFD